MIDFIDKIYFGLYFGFFRKTEESEKRSSVIAVICGIEFLYLVDVFLIFYSHFNALISKNSKLFFLGVATVVFGFNMSYLYKRHYIIIKKFDVDDPNIYSFQVFLFYFVPIGVFVFYLFRRIFYGAIIS